MILRLASVYYDRCFLANERVYNNAYKTENPVQASWLRSTCTQRPEVLRSAQAFAHGGSAQRQQQRLRHSLAESQEAVP